LCLGMTTTDCVLVAVALVAATIVVATLLRAAWLAFHIRAALRTVPLVPSPPELTDVIARTATRDVVCVNTPEATAFCGGLLRPRVYVSTGLVQRLGSDQLRAVLLHEIEHARRRDPLRRLVHRALADVGFVVPLLAWWAARHQRHSELRADRAAITAVGARPVAAAMLAVAAPVASAAGFGGATEARVAQLLGDTVPRQPPSLPVCLVSLVNLVILVDLAMCVGQALLAAL
jgi:Zn-dependent protease with chaperone function